MSFFANPVIGIISAPLAILLAGLLLLSRCENDRLEDSNENLTEQVQTERNNLNTCRRNNAELNSGIAEQNERITALRQEGERLNRNLANLREDASRAARIRNRPAPRSCEELDNLILEAVR